MRVDNFRDEGPRVASLTEGAPAERAGVLAAPAPPARRSTPDEIAATPRPSSSARIMPEDGGYMA
jgi:hypothetical protein